MEFLCTAFYSTQLLLADALVAPYLRIQHGPALFQRDKLSDWMDMYSPIAWRRDSAPVPADHAVLFFLCAPTLYTGHHHPESQLPTEVESHAAFGELMASFGIRTAVCGYPRERQPDHDRRRIQTLLTRTASAVIGAGLVFIVLLSIWLPLWLPPLLALAWLMIAAVVWRLGLEPVAQRRWIQCDWLRQRTATRDQQMEIINAELSSLCARVGPTTPVVVVAHGDAGPLACEALQFCARRQVQALVPLGARLPAEIPPAWQGGIFFMPVVGVSSNPRTRRDAAQLLTALEKAQWKPRPALVDGCGFGDGSTQWMGTDSLLMLRRVAVNFGHPLDVPADE